MKFTIFVTHQCNLRCSYCYIEKRQKRMSIPVAKKVVDFIFNRSILNEEPLEIGFFGGEPLSQFNLIKKITNIILNHPLYSDNRVKLSIITNGTIFSNEIADFVDKHNIALGISCDGPPFIQDKFRLFPNGNPSSKIVEENIIKVIASLSRLTINAVYHPETFEYLPETIEYLISLGVKHIYLNPDYSANWTKENSIKLAEIYDKIGDLYIGYYKNAEPIFISLIDSKIAVIIRGGYGKLERCRMGKGEFAFTTNGDIYPCERLVGNGKNEHCIGNVFEGLDADKRNCRSTIANGLNSECLECGIKDYCMNSCGCSNYMSSGSYNRVSAFICSAEKAALKTSFRVFQALERSIGPTFYNHLEGRPILNSIS